MHQIFFALFFLGRKTENQLVEFGHGILGPKEAQKGPKEAQKGPREVQNEPKYVLNKVKYVYKRQNEVQNELK